MRLHDYIEYYARNQPDATFAEYNLPEGKQIISYSEANQRANQLARALLAEGLIHGDRFSYLSRNSSDMVLMYFAAAKAGVVPVPLNYRLAPREWLYILNDAEAKMLIADAEYVEGIQGIHNELIHTKQFVSIGDTTDNWQEHETLIGRQVGDNLGLDIKDSDQLYQMYTSGTTGLPKGTMISHRAIDNNLGMLARVMNLRQSQERTLVVAPLYHAGAGVISMACISVGATLVIHRDFDPIAAVDSLIEDEITVAGLVPSMVQACLVAVPDIKTRKFPTLRSMLYGASPIAEETLREAMIVFECDFQQIFGMTETSAASTSLSPEDHQKALHGQPELLLSAGRPVLGTEVKIVDEDDNEVPRGTIGEIAVRGPQLMSGYWNLEEATLKSLKGGWMHTGDAATMDEQGYIFIQDRIKDMIVSGGENVYPREVENALFEHPDIADAAVIGIPSEKWGEAILAFIVMREGKLLTTDDLIQFSRERLAGYKLPKQFEFIGELPRNASGKVLKKDLREPYWQGIDRRVS
jgi:acyl-CoA synthetase (AMP-forming)/AMP-acid ligase II